MLEHIPFWLGTALVGVALAVVINSIFQFFFIRRRTTFWIQVAILALFFVTLHLLLRWLLT